MAAVSTMILRSLRLTGEKGRADTLTSTEAVQCLDELNTFMDACNIERLLCYQITQESFALTAGTASYAIGPGGAFNTVRPTKLVPPCFVRDSSNLDSPLNIIDSVAYGSIVQKNVGTTYPAYIYYDYGFSATSTGTITVYPVPSASLTLFINSWKQLQSFSTVSVQLALPPGYQLFIESNFAIHMAAGQVPISKELAMMAAQSKANIKNLNAPDVIAKLDYVVPAGGGRSSILTGP